MSDQEDITLDRKAKTRRGKKILESREPKLEEGPKHTLFIRGVKSTDDVRDLMSQWHLLKKDQSTIYTKKHELNPFEDATQMEQFCDKSNCNMFCLVSNSKKRPNNVIIGRTFDKKILDMVELGLVEFKGQEEFTTQLNIPIHSRPLIIFNGDVFGYNGAHMKIHNLFTDFFYENVETDGIKNSNDLSLIISITADEQKLSITTFQRQLIIEEDLMKVEEIGPRCVFEIRRQKWADEDIFKKACRQPKPKKKAHLKNVVHDGMGDKRGRVFVQQQDLSTLALKKRKKLRRKVEETNGQAVEQEQEQQQQEQE